MSPLVIGLVLALASALALNGGFALQHHGASRVLRISVRQPVESARGLLAAPRWVAGFILGLAGWALYLAAQARAPLSLVQAVAAGGIGLLVLGVALTRRQLPGRREASAALLATAGLVALGLSVAGAPLHRPDVVSAPRVLACACVVSVVAGLLSRRRSAGAGGTGAGLWYGLGDVASKALLVSLPAHPGIGAVLADPYLALALAGHGLGFATLQRSFARGGVVASVAPLTAAMNLLPIAAGVLVLGDPMPGSPPLLALRLTAFAAAAAGAALLAGSTDVAGERPAPQVVASFGPTSRQGRVSAR